MTRAELLERLRDLKPWLAEQGIENLRLFGSFARDEAGPDSDVDLLVDVTKPMGLDFFGLPTEIGERLGRKVDLCTDRGMINPYLRSAVMRDAIVV